MNNRFLYIGGFELPDKNAAAHRVLTIGKMLRELGYETTFLDVDEDRTPDQLSQLHYVEGFETYSMGYPKSVGQWFKYVTYPQHVQELLSFHNDWCGIITYNYSAISTLRLIRICKKKGIKLLGDITEWYIEQFQFKLRYFAVRVDTFLRMRIINKMLDGIILISDYLGNYYKKQNKIVLPPLVDINDKKWLPVSSVRKNSKIVLSYAGSPGKHKDKLNVLIDVFSKLNNSDIMMQIIGVTYEQYKDMYPEDVLKLNTLISQGRIKFIGLIDHKSVLEYIKTSSYCVFYRPETLPVLAGFPTKLVESISCGTPVITNLTDNLKFYFEHYNLGHFLETRNFKANLQYLLENMSLNSCTKLNDYDLFDYHRFIPGFSSFLATTLSRQD